jgi:hypothetical protein
MVLAALAAAQSADLAERVRAALAESLEKTPKYTCTETIERVGPGQCAGCRVTDRVRLEVVVADGMDLYALPGGQVTDDAELRRYIPPGSFHAGNFSGTLKGILLDAAERQFLRRIDSDKPQLVFSYRVPVEAGAYELGWGRQFAKAGYEGSFRVDAKTLRLARLDSEVFGFPGGWDLERLASRTTYRPVSIEGNSFALPASSEVTARAGAFEYKIRMEFSGCRQYAAESAIRFGEPAPEVTPLKPAVRNIPAGLDFEARLEDSINLLNAAAGDRIVARVTSKSTPEVPRGSVLKGRISRLVRTNQSREQRWQVGVRFTEIEIAGVTQPLRAIVQARRPNPFRNNVLAGEEMVFAWDRPGFGPVLLRCTTLQAPAP